MNSSTFFAVTVILVITIFQIPSTWSVVYSGEYDIPAKDMAYLCKLIDEYKVTGMQPKLDEPIPTMPKDTYMNAKANKCWKFQWTPCSENEFGKVKPCGWYQMAQAPKETCN